MTIKEITSDIILDRDELKFPDSTIINYRPVGSPLTHAGFISAVKLEMSRTHKVSIHKVYPMGNIYMATKYKSI